MRRTRPGSHPLITGDGFRGAADAVIDALEPGLPRNPVRRGAVVFLGLDGDDGDAETRIERALPVLRGTAVVLHNGDRLPANPLLAEIAERASAVWCVNYLGDDPRIRALPVGIENRWLCENGDPADFGGRIGPDAPRAPRILAAFRTHTAPDRPAQLSALRELPTCDVIDWLPPRDLHRRMQRYMLVASPPGNGPDCHRTWEAMYLGAVPVVLRAAFPRFGPAFPVLALDDFRELAGWSADAIAAAHAAIAAEATDALWIDWWIDRIRRSATDGDGIRT